MNVIATRIMSPSSVTKARSFNDNDAVGFLTLNKAILNLVFSFLSQVRHGPGSGWLVRRFGSSGIYHNLIDLIVSPGTISESLGHPDNLGRARKISG